MSSTSKNGRVFWTAAVLVIILDVITKYLVVQHLEPHVPVPVAGEFARLTLAYNPGAAFSMSLGDYSRYIFGAFAVIALIILYRLFIVWQRQVTSPRDALVRSLALGLAWGGAAGNLIDRIHSVRGVVDFIDIGVGDVRFWTFNVADSAVTVGALMLAVVLWREDRQALATAASEAAARDNAPFST
jgi:signal peptidase II